MARLIKIKEFKSNELSGPQNNRFCWMEIREGWYERLGALNLEHTYGGRPYPALISSWRDLICRKGYTDIVGQLRVDGGYSTWFNVANYNHDGYNVKWRLWTKCPSEEQRKNTPWDVDTL